jgi:hypothetical protein
MNKTLFRDLKVGDTFDFIDDENRMYNSFYDRCVKLSAMTYKSIEPETRPERYTGTYQVGSIKAQVFHVEAGQ